MATYDLKKRTVDGLRPAEKVYTAYDCNLSGFGCRVSPSGVKSWIVEFRPFGGGRRAAKRRVTIGRVGTVPLERARRSAGEILARARLGEDVSSEIQERRQALTVRELAERYIHDEVRLTCKPRTHDLYDRYLRNHILPSLGSRRAVDLTKADVMALHRRIGERLPPTANRVVMFLSGLFSWGRDAGLLPEHFAPTRRIKRFPEQAKERFLKMDEIARLGSTLSIAETIGLPWEADATKPTAKHAPRVENRRVILPVSVTGAIRLLLFTGCRLREILNLKWEEVDLERGMLFLPDSKTGRKTVVLGNAAVEVLKRLPRMGKFVIPSSTPDLPRRDLHRPWAAVIRHANLSKLRIHDLRHSFAATGAENYFGLQVVGQLLGHRDPETTNRYAHLSAEPLFRAADAISAQLAAALVAAPMQKDTVDNVASVLPRIDAVTRSGT